MTAPSPQRQHCCTHRSIPVRHRDMWYSKPNTPSSLLYHPCSTCAPLHERGWKHYSTAPPGGNKHETQPQALLQHLTAPPDQPQKQAQAMWIHIPVSLHCLSAYSITCEDTHALKNMNANTLSEAGSCPAEAQVDLSAAVCSNLMK